MKKKERDGEMAKKKTQKKSQKKVATKATKKVVKKAIKKVLKKAASKVAKKSITKKAAPKKAAPATKAAPIKKSVKVVLSAKMTNYSKLISPLDDRLIVQIEKGEQVTAGGIIIPDTTELTGNIRGLVVAIGRGHLNKKGHVKPMDVKIGDLVLVNQHAGEELPNESASLRIVRESDVLGIVEK
jgi:chaperonin GroES